MIGHAVLAGLLRCGPAGKSERELRACMCITWRGGRILLGFAGLGGVLPDEAGGLRVEQLVPEAAADQVGPLRQVEHAPLCRHRDAACLQPHTITPISLPDCSHYICIVEPAVSVCTPSCSVCMRSVCRCCAHSLQIFARNDTQADQWSCTDWLVPPATSCPA